MQLVTCFLAHKLFCFSFMCSLTKCLTLYLHGCFFHSFFLFWKDKVLSSTFICLSIYGWMIYYTSGWLYSPAVKGFHFNKQWNKYAMPYFFTSQNIFSHLNVSQIKIYPKLLCALIKFFIQNMQSRFMALVIIDGTLELAKHSILRILTNRWKVTFFL